MIDGHGREPAGPACLLFWGGNTEGRLACRSEADSIGGSRL